MAKRIFYAHRLATEQPHDITFVNYMKQQGHAVTSEPADDITRVDFSSYDLFILGAHISTMVSFGNKGMLKRIGCSVMSMCPSAVMADGLDMATASTVVSLTTTRMVEGYAKINPDYTGAYPFNVSTLTTGNGFVISNLTQGTEEIAVWPSGVTNKAIAIKESEGQRRMFYGIRNAETYTADGWDLFRRCIDYAMGDSKAFVNAPWGMATITHRGLTILRDTTPDSMKYRRIGTINLERFNHSVGKVSFEASSSPQSAEKTVIEATIRREVAGTPYFESIQEKGIKYFVRSNGIIYNYANEQWSATELISPLTESQFNELGIVENIPAEKWGAITGDYDIILLKNATPPNATPFTLPMQKNEAWLEAGSLFEMDLPAGIQIDRFDGIKVL